MLLKNGTRLTLVSKKRGANFLCIPGGPGLSSESIRQLAELVETKGSVWLVDFPENGDNRVAGRSLCCEKWGEYLIDVVRKFENVIIIGHSFGGQLALSLPEIEQLIDGLVIVNSSPTLWFDAQAEEIKKQNLPSLKKLKKGYEDSPSEATFRPYFISAIPYFVRPEFVGKARGILSDLPYNDKALNWWVETAQKNNWKASWVPKEVSTLIISGKQDAITPYTLFEQDVRFARPNIEHHIIDGAGHFCWIEKPEQVKTLLTRFLQLYEYEA